MTEDHRSSLEAGGSVSSGSRGGRFRFGSGSRFTGAIAAVAAVAAMATVAATATAMATTMAMTTTMATAAVIAAAVATAAITRTRTSVTSMASLGLLLTAQQGDADDREKDRHSKNYDSVHHQNPPQETHRYLKRVKDSIAVINAMPSSADGASPKERHF